MFLRYYPKVVGLEQFQYQGSKRKRNVFIQRIVKQYRFFLRGWHMFSHWVFSKREILEQVENRVTIESENGYSMEGDHSTHHVLDNSFLARFTSSSPWIFVISFPNVTLANFYPFLSWRSHWILTPLYMQALHYRLKTHIVYKSFASLNSLLYIWCSGGHWRWRSSKSYWVVEL